MITRGLGNNSGAFLITRGLGKEYEIPSVVTIATIHGVQGVTIIELRKGEIVIKEVANVIHVLEPPCVVETSRNGSTSIDLKEKEEIIINKQCFSATIL